MCLKIKYNQSIFYNEIAMISILQLNKFARFVKTVSNDFNRFLNDFNRSLPNRLQTILLIWLQSGIYLHFDERSKLLRVSDSPKKMLRTEYNTEKEQSHFLFMLKLHSRNSVTQYLQKCKHCITKCKTVLVCLKQFICIQSNESLWSALKLS